jgi:imidazolonepropionase-like amidohydrolase
MCNLHPLIQRLAAVLVFAILAENQCFAQRLLAIRGAKLETVSKAGAIEDGVILIRDGKIEAIGKEVKIPLAAQVIDAKGKTIMPGIVDPYYVVTVGRDTQLAGETRTVVIRGQTITVPGGSPSSSTSFTKISDSIDLDNIDWKAANRSGITTMQLVVSGYAQSVIVQPTVQSAQIVNPDGKLLVSVTNSTQSLDLLRSGLRAPGSSPGGPPSTSSGTPSPGSGFGRPPGSGRPSPQPPSPAPPGTTPAATNSSVPSAGPTPPVSPTQKLWTDVREGKSSLFVNLNNAAAILHCVNATKESKQTKLVFIAAGSDLFEAIRDLDPKTHVAILPPRIDFVPNTRDRINIPKFLSEKEMPFAFSLSLGQSEFRVQLDTPLFAVSSLVHNGLSRQKALEALTMMPAKLVGVDSEVGSLEVGKKANFLILDGDPFAATTSIQSAFVEGKQIYEN